MAGSQSWFLIWERPQAPTRHCHGRGWRNSFTNGRPAAANLHICGRSAPRSWFPVVEVPRWEQVATHLPSFAHCPVSVSHTKSQRRRGEQAQHVEPVDVSMPGLMGKPATNQIGGAGGIRILDRSSPKESRFLSACHDVRTQVVYAKYEDRCGLGPLRRFSQNQALAVTCGSSLPNGAISFRNSASGRP